MQKLPGYNPLAPSSLYTPIPDLPSGPEVNYRSHPREVRAWAAVFFVNLLVSLVSLVAGIVLFKTGFDLVGGLGIAVSVATLGIAGFLVTRPPWSLTLHAANRKYALLTGFRPFERRLEGELGDVRGIGAATVRRFGEDACALILVLKDAPRPLYLSWHPLASKQIVAREAEKLANKLRVPLLTSKSGING
jgi:hypothetical protein